MTDRLAMLCMYHRDVLVDTSGSPYVNIQCGRQDSGVALDMCDDSFGESISDRNRFWSEITGLFWAHKNLRLPEYVGLCSYRRFFSGIESNRPLCLTTTENADRVISSINYQSLIEALKTSDIVLPVPYTYRQSVKRVIERNYHSSDFKLLEYVISEKYPDFLPSFRRVLSGNSLPGHNMFVMHKSKFSNYCEWVFDVLLTLESLVDPSGYSIDKVRVFGYMHELLLSVYVMHCEFDVKYRQIIWITDDYKFSRFNGWCYRTASEVAFRLSRPAPTTSFLSLEDYKDGS